ncbi:hypothetical protein EIK79_02710 [Halocatena pleomorpha]|uniref:Uncharacterized protein n=1 Tax=Halocatena pleomorpha TaxID=1785090 RepID=A0A3P3RJY5_9EURY|nr:hypothetical protein EIK79_02710 [Halocatena pleomorpha]
MFQFWVLLDESVNVSTVEDRERIFEAELYHVMDVGAATWWRQNLRFLWCKPCRNTGCSHATQIEEILATAGPGRSQVNYDNLSGIATSRATTRQRGWSSPGGARTVGAFGITNSPMRRAPQLRRSHVSLARLQPSTPMTENTKAAEAEAAAERRRSRKRSGQVTHRERSERLFWSRFFAFPRAVASGNQRGA